MLGRKRLSRFAWESTSLPSRDNARTVSQESLERARHAYELWNQGEFEEFTAMVHRDFVFETSGVFPGFEAQYHGPEGMMRFSRTMLEAWKSFRLDVLDTECRGRHVLVQLRFVGTGRESGVEVATEFHHVLRFRDELVDWLISHPTRAGVLEAAGLSE